MKHSHRHSNLLLVILRVALVLALLSVPGAGYACRRTVVAADFGCAEVEFCIIAEASDAMACQQ